jgi:hypothetical protein
MRNPFEDFGNAMAGGGGLEQGDKLPKGENDEPKDLAEVLKVKTRRPNRETVIQKDEITNLTIALETSQDVNDFLKQIGCKL